MTSPLAGSEDAMGRKIVISSDFSKAQRHLGRRDPILKRLIRLVGPCTLHHNPDRFAVLAQSILSQQISTRAAASIRARLEQSLAPEGLTAERVAAASGAALRAAGLSAAMARSLLELAEKVQAGLVPLADLDTLGDDEVIAHLVPVRGIGPWTAQMFLIFSLGRLDVLPVADLGLRAGVKRHYQLPDLPDRVRLEALAEPWRPYRSIATWYVWRSLGFVPQSGG
jgi:DNA-3-methyladenine glycosylase II